MSIKINSNFGVNTLGFSETRGRGNLLRKSSRKFPSSIEPCLKCPHNVKSIRRDFETRKCGSTF